MNASRLSAADPPGASHAAPRVRAIAAAFLLISSPVAVSPITVRTASATFSFSTAELSMLPLATSTQTPHSTTSFALKNCSAPSGHPISGTPWERLSRMEFHPQWLRNAPVDGTRTCGAHPRTSSPDLARAARSSKPSGSHSGLNPSLGSNPSGGRSAQRKGRPLASSPSASSFI
nr:unnamed protein product [Digitaria exilis]